QISIKGISTVETAKINVRQSVVVIVSHRNSRAIEQHAVGRAGLLVQEVGESDPSPFWRQKGESGLSLIGHIQVGPLESFFHVPCRLLAGQKTDFCKKE